MFLLNRVRLLAMGATLGVVGLSGLASPASACEAEHVSYRRVITYETRTQDYVVCVTRYDHCGHAYNAYETRTRLVSVPVASWVRVWN